MPPQTKTHLLTRIVTLLKKRYPVAKPEPRAVLDQVLLALLEEEATLAAAQAALTRLHEQYHGWNEVRVSSLAELQGTLADLPGAPVKAERLRLALRAIFIRYYCFDLEALKKSNQKQAVAQLENLGLHDYVRAAVIRDVLGGHAIPTDQPMLRALRRLGLADDEATPESIRPALERLVPKARSPEFSRLMAALTVDTCVEAAPECLRCCLVELCPTGKLRTLDPAAASEPRPPAKRAARKS